MKHQIKNAKQLLTRVVMGLLLLAMLGGMLTSCGARGGSKITTVTKGYAISANLITEANGMSHTELDKMADAIVSSKNAVTVREQLVAALRGYDMTAADFDDAKVADGTLAAQPEKAPEFAVSVLQKAELDTAACYTLTSEKNSLTMTAARSGRHVYCVITDVDGNSVTSDIATLTMA
jgi:hypothetical protein